MHPRPTLLLAPQLSICLTIILLLAAVPAVGMGPFVNRTSELAPDGLGDGQAAWGDYDNDGWTDIIAGHHLYHNDAGTLRLVFQTYQGLWGDYDNDNYLDFISWGNTDHQRPHRLTHNLGGGEFEIVTLPAMPCDISLAGSWADHDLDGHLDFYMGGYEIWPGAVFPDAVLVNNAATSFTMTEKGARRARGVTACDFDEDGDLDVYASNYRQQPNLLWLNDGKGGLTEVAAERGVAGRGTPVAPAVAAHGHTIGSAWGDLDNDGHIDLFVGNFNHHDGNRWSDDAKFMRNRGPDGGWTFELKDELDGADWQESYASPALGDYDNDGDLDLYFTTVYGTGSFGIRNFPRLYRNDGNWHFTDVTAAEGLGGIGPTYQAAWADYDDDGDLDLASGGRVYVNGGGANHWLKLRLQGDGAKINRAAIGAQVRLKLGDGTVLTRQVEAGTGEGNQNGPALHFGLGSRTDPVSLEILWPNGETQTVDNVSLDRVTQLAAPGQR